jgi:FkbM family methyltransferase
MEKIMEKIGEYWVPAVDVRGVNRRRKTLEVYENGRNGKQINHLMEAIDCLVNEMGMIPLSGVAVDGGANIGAYSRVMAGVFSHVHAFEPAPDTFECLRRNIEEWGITERVTSYPQALSSREENVNVSARWGKLSVSRKITGYDWTGGQIKNDNSANDIRDVDLSKVHYLSGPFGVEGAEPGDLMVVESKIRCGGSPESSLWRTAVGGDQSVKRYLAT